MKAPKEWLALKNADLMHEIVSGEPGSHNAEIAKNLLSIRYQEEVRDLTRAQANSAKVMEEVAKCELAVSTEASNATKNQAARAREGGDIAERALKDNKRMILYTMWVAIATAVAAVVTLITQVALIAIELKKK
jgi:hypothetical protein